MANQHTERQTGRRGPRPKGGGRQQHTIRVPYADSALFQQIAMARGLAMTDWFPLAAYEATGTPIPDYITRQLEQHREEQRKRDEIQPMLW